MGVGCVEGCQYDSRKCYRKMMKSASKGELVKNNDIEMEDFSEEGAKETQRSKTGVNMVYTVEFPEEESLKRREVLNNNGTLVLLLEAPPFKHEIVHTKLVEEIPPALTGRFPRVLMIEAPPVIVQRNSFQKGIVEEVSDDEEDERVARARKGKSIMEEDITSVHGSRAGKRKEERLFSRCVCGQQGGYY